MATFLTTKGVNQHLEKLITSTQEKLILISPYLQFSESIRACIGSLHKYKPDIRIVYRKDKLGDVDRNWLASQITIITSLCPDLHSKCYINENEAIITSMNLYEYSQLNNEEMGIHITSASDKELYQAAYKEARRLIQISEDFRISSGAQEIVIKQTTPNKKISGNDNFDWGKSKTSTGYCIRTGVPIPFDLEKPLCKEAYNSWKQYEEVDYPEKFCHFSGEPSHGKTTYDKPILKKNWNKAQDVYGF